MKRTLTTLALSAALIGVTAPSAQASEYGYVYDTYGGFPFATDVIPIENITGTNDTTGVNRWEATGNIDFRWVSYEPSNGIYFRADSTLTARTGAAANADATWTYVASEGGFRTTRCKITYQTGLPSLKKQMVLTHEVAHCLGHYKHRDSSTSVLRAGTRGWSTYYKPTSSDLTRLRDIHSRNG